MDDAELKLPTVVGGTVVLTIFLAVALTVTDAWQSSNAAGWAQAFAATLAIVAGAYGLYWQAGNQRKSEVRREAAEEVRRLNILYGAVYDLRIRIKASTWHELGPFETDWERPDQAAKLLRTVPLLDVPDWRVAFAMRQAVDTYAMLRRTVPYRGKGDPHRVWTENAYRLIEAADAHVMQAQDHIRAAIEQRKAKAPIIAAGHMSSEDD